jgi:hypothetical protein
MDLNSEEGTDTVYESVCYVCVREREREREIRERECEREERTSLKFVGMRDKRQRK